MHNTTYTQNFTGLKLNLSKTRKGISEIRDLPEKYIDTFIQAMAESSSNKHTNSISLHVLPRLERIKFHCEAEHGVNSWFIRSLFPSQNYCIFFHGGTSTVSNYQNLYKELSNKNINILAVEYPGYGDNRNVAVTYDAINMVAENAYKYLTTNLNVKPDNINIMGYCLGGQVATNLASKVDCKSLVLISPVSKFSQISEGYIKSKNIGERFDNRFVKWFVNTPIFRFFVANKLSLYENLENVKSPVYVMSSEKNAVTHMKWMDKLTKALLDKDKRVVYLRGFEDGHKLTDSKINIISSLISSDTPKM